MCVACLGHLGLRELFRYCAMGRRLDEEKMEIYFCSLVLSGYAVAVKNPSLCAERASHVSQTEPLTFHGLDTRFQGFPMNGSACETNWKIMRGLLRARCKIEGTSWNLLCTRQRNEMKCIEVK